MSHRCTCGPDSKTFTGWRQAADGVSVELLCGAEVVDTLSQEAFEELMRKMTSAMKATQ